MYDGNHSEDSHYRALNHYYECLDDIFIFLVDDWNWDFVRNQTRKSIEDILYEKEIKYDRVSGETWWNGIYAAILKKNA